MDSLCYDKAMRIQKYLSQQGLLSRRKAEEYLVKGWIRVNGQGGWLGETQSRVVFQNRAWGGTGCLQRTLPWLG